MASLEALRDRYRRTAGAFEVLESIVPDMVRLLEAGIERVPIEQQINAFKTLPEEQHAAALTALERDVVAFERSFEALDRKIPSRWFRSHAEVTGANVNGYTDYCRLLARYAGPDDVLRLERVRTIIERLTELVWPRAHATVDQRRDLAAHALPPSQVPHDVVRQAIAHFIGLAARLERFDSLDALIASDFLPEARVYVLSLRDKVLDPTICMAIIDLGHAIGDAVQRLAAGGPIPEAQLRAASRRMDDAVAKLREDESATEKGFDAFQRRRAAFEAKEAEKARALARAERRRKEREQWDPPKRRWPSVAVVIALAITVWWRWPSGPNEQPLPADEIAQLSPLLTSASVGGTKKAKVLLARVEPQRWDRLDATARRGAARELAIALNQRGLKNGTVFKGESIAVEIREGEVFIVR